MSLTKINLINLYIYTRNRLSFMQIKQKLETNEFEHLFTWAFSNRFLSKSIFNF